jgi:type IV pilus assembly protein PilE
MRSTLARRLRRASPAMQTGFTLVELMIVCAVIAVLAAIAYPSYTGQMLKAQRSEGKAALMRAAQLLERSFTQNGAYPSGAGALATLYGGGLGAAVYSNPDNPLSATMGKFLIEYVPDAGAAPVQFVLRATPQASSLTDSDCPTFGMDSRGRRLVSDAVPTAASRCWR